MYSLEIIKRGVKEFGIQASIVQSTYGLCKLWWISDMIGSLVLYGARPIDYVRFEFYKKKHRERNRFETFYRQLRLIKKLQKKCGLNIGDNKELEYKLYKDFIRRNFILVKPTDSSKVILDFVKKYSVVIAKPTEEALGRGVVKLDVKNDQELSDFLRTKRTSTYLIEECLQNCMEISNINESSLNTMRVGTYIDKDGFAHIFTIILRVGLKGMHVDNWGAGGIAYHVDIDTGIIDQPGVDKNNNKYIYHPYTNINMVGFKIPMINELKQFAIDLALKYPKTTIVGWDIAITPTGLDFIEMNCPGGHDLMQAFGTPIYGIIKDCL